MFVALATLVLVAPSGQAIATIDTHAPNGVIPGMPLLACWDEGAYPVATSQNYDLTSTPDNNFWILFQNVEGEVFVSWTMQTDSIPPDGYAFGVFAKNSGAASTLISDTGDASQAGTCRWVGQVQPGSFDYSVRGGAMNIENAEECTSTTWWETSTKTEFWVSVLERVPSGGGSIISEHKFGGSSSCTSSTEYQTDLILEQDGETSSSPIFGILEVFDA